MSNPSHLENATQSAAFFSWCPIWSLFRVPPGENIILGRKKGQQAGCLGRGRARRAFRLLACLICGSGYAQSCTVLCCIVNGYDWAPPRRVPGIPGPSARWTPTFLAAACSLYPTVLHSSLRDRMLDLITVTDKVCVSFCPIYRSTVKSALIFFSLDFDAVVNEAEGRKMSLHYRSLDVTYFTEWLVTWFSVHHPLIYHAYVGKKTTLAIFLHAIPRSALLDLYFTPNSLILAQKVELQSVAVEPQSVAVKLQSVVVELQSVAVEPQSVVVRDAWQKKGKIAGKSKMPRVQTGKFNLALIARPV